MPKRSATSPDGAATRSTKRHHGESSSSRNGKRKRHRLPVAFEPLILSIAKWRCTNISEDNDEDVADTTDSGVVLPTTVSVSRQSLHEAGPMTWSKVLANYQSNSRSIPDVVFQTSDGKEVKGHSLVLRIRVPFFASLFPGKHSVSKSTNLPEACVVLPIAWADSETLQNVMDVAYLIKTPKDIPESELPRLYTAAMFIGWEELETGCYEDFQERLNTANCLAWLEWAVINRNALVKHRSATFAAAHLETLHEERDQELVRLSLEAHLAIVRLT
ncbi:hypothetical protein BV898_19087 [Hypsibius exemplaris]|uniref:BTB domain-containing protein n=1 Tax=Hypsibius exemplaris TaxID=2072580 RepID=A0A9X6NKU0_HYPEX|nr:hypothetical protein BV898_19087 [Hypsibius exemplaris]